MRSAKVNVGDSGLASQYNNLRSDAYAASVLLVHQQNTPGMTLYVEGGTCYVGAIKVVYAGGNTPSFTAPVSNPRIDIVTIDNTGTIAITQGTENASPAAPAYPASKLVLAEIYNRVGETTIYDTDQGAGKGYVYNDVRPFVGGSYIASDAQVDPAANISVSKLNAGAVNTDFIPDTTNTRALGTAAKQWLNLYAQNIYQNGNPLAAAKFGGTGADGALNISSGVTNINLGGAAIVVKNYSSISITGTASITFSNPGTHGTLIIFKCQGNCTITSSANPTIDLNGMGAQATNNWAGGLSGGADGVYGIGFIRNPEGGYITRTDLYSMNSQHYMYGKAKGVNNYGSVYSKFPDLFCGGAGMGGTGVGNDNGTPGKGGGALYIECAGALNFSGVIRAQGTAGGSSAGSHGNGNQDFPCAGAGYGDSLNVSANFVTGGFSNGSDGGSGSIIIRANTITANTGTLTVSSVGNGGIGYSEVSVNTELA